MIVELEQNVWLAQGEGDPPRTIIKENAARFNSLKDACSALTEARRYKAFPNATIASDDVFTN